MSVSSDKADQERLARQTAIKKAIAPSEQAEPTEQPKAQPQRTYHGRPLRPYERINARGMVEQFRPASVREQEEDSDAAFMASVKRQADEHKAKVDKANRENELEQKRLDQQRERELRTGRRPLRDPNRISLAEAMARGLIGQGSGSSSEDGDNWSSPGNVDGLFCGGR